MATAGQGKHVRQVHGGIESAVPLPAKFATVMQPRTAGNPLHLSGIGSEVDSSKNGDWPIVLGIATSS